MSKLKIKLKSINLFDALLNCFAASLICYVLYLLPWAVEKEAQYNENKQQHYIAMEFNNQWNE